MQRLERPQAAALLVLLAAGASLVVYRDALHAYFWSDDFVLFYLRRDTSLAEFLLNPFWGHIALARNALFAATDQMAGLDPLPYFVTVLATHVLNVVLLGRLIWRLTDSPGLAGIGALLWGICPTASESLGWYAAYGHIAATTCLLLACDVLARHAGRSGTLPARAAVIAGAWLGVSLLWFGTGLAVAVVWPAVVVLLFPETRTDNGPLRAAVATTASLLALYTLLQLVARGLYGSHGVVGQTLRLLVEVPGVALIAFVQLVRVGVASLLLGAWWAPGPRSDPVSWGVLLCATAVWLAAFAAGNACARRRLAAFSLVAFAVYALTAGARAPAARQLVGRSAAGVAATLRYHYVPQAFLAVTLCVAAGSVAARWTAASRAVVGTVWVALLALGVVRRGIAIDRHDEMRTAVAAARADIRDRVEATPRGGTAYIRNRALPGFGWLPETTTPLPGMAGLFMIESPSDEVDGRLVRFVEPDQAVRALVTRRGGRLARLLVQSGPPDGVSSVVGPLSAARRAARACRP